MIKAGEFKIDNIKAQMRKGVLEFIILLIIAENKVYAREILSKLKNSNFILVEGTLYPILRRLIQGGLVSSEWQESKSGPPRKYYELTPIGRTNLNQLKKSWEHFEISVNHIIENLK